MGITTGAFKIPETKEPDETQCVCAHSSPPEFQWSSPMMYNGEPKSLNPHFVRGRNEAYCPIILL